MTTKRTKFNDGSMYTDGSQYIETVSEPRGWRPELTKTKTWTPEPPTEMNNGD